MKKLNVIIVLFLALNSFAQVTADKIKLLENDLFHWDKTKTKKWTLKDRMDFYNVHGVSIAVIKDFKVEWSKGYGFADVSEKRPVTTQTLFQAASISKSINSLAQLKLVEEGKLGLNNDINTYLKDWKFPYDSVSKGKKISLANLLSHMGGLSTSGFRGYAQGEKLPTIIEVLNGTPPANSSAVRSIFEPGTKFQYSGGGTTISQLMLENVTGQKYENYMLKNILSPLGMTESSFNQPPAKDKANLLATGYNNGIEVKGKYHIYPEQAAAALWTNPNDLSKYIIETQLSLLGKSNKILSKEMSQKRIDNNLGVFLNDFKGSKYFGHSGGNEGFVCYYVGSVEDGNGCIVMTNGRTMKIVEEIFTSIASTNEWKNFPLAPITESIALTIRKETLKNADNGIALYQKLKKEDSKTYNFADENELNQLGYELLGDKRTDDAIKIFSLNITEFPKSFNVYDSRGEAYFAKKDYILAKKDYQKVLEIDSANSNAKAMLVKIDDLLKK
ncbi:hypothetical protein B4N84_23440 [Flavobacterium sp. IR1]|nr:hypothetical protein B4N84_23440 [Flavobacterium sp. IR1]